MSAEPWTLLLRHLRRLLAIRHQSRTQQLLADLVSRRISSITWWSGNSAVSMLPSASWILGSNCVPTVLQPPGPATRATPLPICLRISSTPPRSCSSCPGPSAPAGSYPSRPEKAPPHSAPHSPAHPPVPSTPAAAHSRTPPATGPADPSADPLTPHLLQLCASRGRPQPASLRRPPQSSPPHRLHPAVLHQSLHRRLVYHLVPAPRIAVISIVADSGPTRDLIPLPCHRRLTKIPNNSVIPTERSGVEGPPHFAFAFTCSVVLARYSLVSCPQAFGCSIRSNTCAI